MVASVEDRSFCLGTGVLTGWAWVALRALARSANLTDGVLIDLAIGGTPRGPAEGIGGAKSWLLHR